jgi:hypothetical protein
VAAPPPPRLRLPGFSHIPSEEKIVMFGRRRRRLAALKDQGVLTQEEFDAEKAKILASASA